MMEPDEQALVVEPGLRRLLLLEIIFPMVLLILGIYHGLMQTLYRAGIIHRSEVLGLEYFQGLTLHGVVNAIVFTTFFAVAFGYAVIRFHLRRPLNLKVAWLSCALMVIGTVLTAAAILSGQATVLYTFYPPLRAHPAFYIGLVLVVVGSWLAFFNWLPPYFAWKREHRGEKVPLAVVGIFATFIVWLIATTPVAIEILFLLIPWSMGWVPTINVPLARMLFWFFGHPLVYFWLLPTYVMYYTMLPRLCGGSSFPTSPGASPFSGSFSIPLRSEFTISLPNLGLVTPGSSCMLSLPCSWRSRALRLPSRWPRRWSTAPGRRAAMAC
jgi:cytochrome c oxidase subunit 1